MKEKLTSRKFWISIAAFLGSIAASVAGLMTDHEWITIVGVICGVISAAIYAAAEAYTDGKAASAKTISVIVNTDSIAAATEILKKVA